MAPSDVQDVFTRAVEAVLSAQAELDTRVTPRYILGCMRKEERLLHFLRKVDINLQYRFERGQATKILFFFPASQSRTIHRHTLAFSIQAAPAPPVPPSPVSVSAPGVATMNQPDFLVLPEDAKPVLGTVAALFRSGQVANKFTNPPQFSPDYTAEAAEITRAQDPEAPGRGTLVFSLSDGSPAYLIVRVTEKQHADGIYLYDPQAGTVNVYSFPGVAQDCIHYTPLHRFALAVRRSLTGPLVLRREIAAGRIEALLGLRTFAGQLCEAYVAAWDRLAKLQADGPLPSFFDLSDAEATVRYSVAYDEQNNVAHLDLVNCTGPAEEPEADPFRTIEGSASIRLSRVENQVRTAINIPMPGFVLSGAILKQFLLLARDRDTIRRIVNLMAPDDPAGQDHYAALIRTRSDVVALHAFKQNRPTGEFLVIWHGEINGVDRDFAFTCTAGDGALKPGKRVLALEQDADAVEITDIAPDADLENNEYKAFHNMFHAVRIWQSTMSPSEQPGA